MLWNFERIGVNIVCCYTEKRKNVIFLEYDHEYNCFKEYSDYLITEHFIYNNRQYARNKSGNTLKYWRLLSDIDFHRLHNFMDK